MTDKDRPTRQFIRYEKRELLTAEGKSYDPPIFYHAFYDREDGEYELLVYSEVEDETEKKIDAFGGLIDRTAERDFFEPCPIAFAENKKRAALALKEGRLREFIEDAVKKDYDKWPNEIRPEIRDLLIDFSLAYWRRELFDYYGKVDGEGEAEPEGPAENIDTENNIRIMPTGSTFNDCFNADAAADIRKNLTDLIGALFENTISPEYTGLPQYEDALKRLTEIGKQAEEYLEQYRAWKDGAQEPEEDAPRVKEPIKRSAAFFDDDISCAKTLEQLDQIAAELETHYVGTEDNRQRLLKRIEAKRARITGETPEGQEPRVMETETSPGAILEELAPLFPYGGMEAKIIVDQRQVTNHIFNTQSSCILTIRWRETEVAEKATEIYQAISKLPGISRLDWEITSIDSRPVKG